MFASHDINHPSAAAAADAAYRYGININDGNHSVPGDLEKEGQGLYHTYERDAHVILPVQALEYVMQRIVSGEGGGLAAGGVCVCVCGGGGGTGSGRCVCRGRGGGGAIGFWVEGGGALCVGLRTRGPLGCRAEGLCVGLRVGAPTQ